MRKVLLAIAGATALAFGTAASAAVTVDSGTVVGLNNPDPSDPNSIKTVDGTTTINFGQNPVGATFASSFTIHNDNAGLYSIVVGTSDLNTFFDSVVFNGVALTNLYNNQEFRLLPPMSLDVGDYTFSLTGHNNGGGSFTGNVTISAVPEPATWAMMLLGFGAIGFSMRSRRRVALAQVA